MQTSVLDPPAPRLTTGRHIAGAWILVAASVFLAGALVVERDLGWIRLRTLLPPVLVLVVASLAWARHTGTLRERWRVAATLVLPALLLAVVPLVLERTGDAAWDVLDRLSTLAVGTSLLLALPRREASAVRWRVEVRRWHVAALVISFALLAALAHRSVAGGGSIIVDDTLYIVQARLLSEGLVRHIPAALVPFFALRQAAVAGGAFVPQYPPGWPAILAGFTALGLQWWTGVLCSVAVVWLTYLLGRRLQSRTVGIVAAAIAGLAPVFASAVVGYSAHPGSMVTVLCAAHAMLSATEARGWKAAAAWALAGMALSGCILIRPLTGVAMGLTLFFWIWARRRFGLAGAAQAAAWMAVGALPGLLALLAYNAATTGSPLRFGYAAANGPLHDLGFGTRGMILWSHTGVARADAGPFTVVLGLRHLLDRAWDTGVNLIPGAFLLATAGVAWTSGFRPRVSTVAAFAILPVFQFFWFYSDAVYYLELLPFLAVAVAMAFTRIARNAPATVRPLLVAFLLSATVGTVAGLVANAQLAASRRQFFQSVTEARRQHGKVIVFVNDSPERVEPLFESLYWFNQRSLSDSVIVARDLGAANSVLTHAYPDHTPLLAVWSGTGEAQPLRPAVPPTTARPARAVD